MEKNLISFYNSLIVSNILESFNEFSDEIEDIEGLSEIFLQNVINNSRESMDNILAYSLTGDGKFLLPLFEGGQEHDSSALLLSLFRKKVNKQQINGGSAVQVSALGITAKEESGDLQYIMDPNDKHNILYAEIEIPFDLSYKDSKGRKNRIRISRLV